VAQGWQRVVPGGDCQCADGSEFAFWMREADPERVVFYLQDGGACFNEATCAFDSGTYPSTTDSDDDPTDEPGIFQLDDPRNPFAEWSMVYVPYCTGDLHLGTVTTPYSATLTVQHKGFVNGTAALDALASTFPRATEIVVAGESAGAAPAPLYAGLAADLLPDASVTVLADGAGSYPDQPGINAAIGVLWGTAATIPDWSVNEGLTLEQWSLPGLFVQAGRHVPDLVLARHDYAYDAVQTIFGQLAGFGGDDLLTAIDANEAQIEQGGVDLLSYIAPGSEHTVLTSERFYTEAVNGVPLLDWVTALANGTPVADVHCTECAGG